MTETDPPKKETETDSDWIPREDWKTIVQNVPIVSVDLVVLHDDDVLLGKRKNKPAKGEWFVPGGRINKNESLEEAAHRIVREELGVKIEIIERLGTYEHLYQESDVPSSNGKHYIATRFLAKSLTPDRNPKPDDQHEELRVFKEIPQGLHRYSKQYFEEETVRKHLKESSVVEPGNR